MEPTDGFPVNGNVKVKGHEFVTTMPAAQLLKITNDPRLSEDPKRRDGNPNLEELYRIRQEVQRMFQGAKEKNVDSYAQYIVALEDGKSGITPQIVLYTPRDLQYDSPDTPTRLYLPWDVELVAIDGQTQLTARFEAAKINSATTKQMVDVKLCYNRPLEWAKQAFHDLNLLSVRPNAATAISMDMRDPLTSITRQVAQTPFFKDRVASSRQLKKRTVPSARCRYCVPRWSVSAKASLGCSMAISLSKLTLDGYRRWRRQRWSTSTRSADRLSLRWSNATKPSRRRPP